MSDKVQCPTCDEILQVEPYQYPDGMGYRLHCPVCVAAFYEMDKETRSKDIQSFIQLVQNAKSHYPQQLHKKKMKSVYKPVRGIDFDIDDPEFHPILDPISKRVLANDLGHFKENGEFVMNAQLEKMWMIVLNVPVK